MRKIIPFAAALTTAAIFAGPSLNAASRASEERAARDQAVLDKALAGKVPGRPQSCIPLSQVRGTTYVGENTILYRISAKLIYRNDPVGGCPGMNRDSALVTRTTTAQLCSGDIAQVRDFNSGFSAGSCALAEFVPYRAQ